MIRIKEFNHSLSILAKNILLFDKDFFLFWKKYILSGVRIGPGSELRQQLENQADRGETFRKECYWETEFSEQFPLCYCLQLACRGERLYFGAKYKGIEAEAVIIEAEYCTLE